LRALGGPVDRREGTLHFVQFGLKVDKLGFDFVPTRFKNLSSP
jgi:hypothetical protein